MDEEDSVFDDSTLYSKILCSSTEFTYGFSYNYFEVLDSLSLDYFESESSYESSTKIILLLSLLGDSISEADGIVKSPLSRPALSLSDVTSLRIPFCAL